MIGFSLEQPADGKPASAGNGAHVAFIAESRAQVDEFHRAALAHGGSDAGPPGLRPEYDANYYGAFVRDPDGNKVEAVCFMAK
jgi:catechol 2,3-dioxygenase-like lactoylglutathione lyase family enzyme